MRDTVDRLPWISTRDPAKALAAIAEAVWWVTIVDATLVRYHPETYDRVLNCRSAAERQEIEGTLAGLRFVRNQMGHDVDHVDFVHLTQERPSTRSRTTDWKWSRLPAPDLRSLSPEGQTWEMTRYQEYLDRLADRTVGETFRQAAGFLNLTAAEAVQPSNPTKAKASGH